MERAGKGNRCRYFGINFLWEVVFYNFSQFKPDGIFETRNELVELTLYSIFLFFFLSNNSEALINPYSSHPHPRVRFECILIFTEKIVVSNFFSIDELYKAVEKVFHEFNNTFAFNFGQVNRKDYYRTHESTEIIRVVKKILQNYLDRDKSLNYHRRYSWK